MMKALLIKPPSSHVEGSAKPSVSLPLGLLSIAAVLEKNGYDVGIYDAEVNARIPVRDVSGRGMHMGDSWEAVEQEIAARKPDIAGITCLFTTQLENAVKTAEIVKKINAGTVTIIGGSHASVRPGDFFSKTEAVDIVCIGEGEITMLEIAEALKNKRNLKDLSGIALRADGKIAVNPKRPYIEELDTLPLPSYHLVNMEDYFTLQGEGFSGRPVYPGPGFNRAVSIITSRGCPYNCIFCSAHLHMGRAWRCHSSKYVLEHINLLKSKYGVKHIHFEDDNLTLDAGRFKDMLKGLISESAQVTWDTPNGVRADAMTEDLLRDSKDSGCIYLIFGVESGDQKILDSIVKKQLKLSAVVNIASICKKMNLDTMAFYVIGFPGETKQDINTTVDFALRLQREHDVLPSLFIATPLPGTDLEKICIENGILKRELSPQELAEMTQGAILMDGGTFKIDDIKEALKRFYKMYKINLVLNSLLFFLRHPAALIRFFKLLFNGREFPVKKERILSVLELKNCLTRNF